MMRVLIASSDLVHTKMTRFLLEDVGYELGHAADDRSVLTALEDSHYDLILLDHGCSDINGTVLCREIRARYHLPIIFVASANAIDDRVVGLKLGADDYLGKPYDPNELLARIEAVMRRYGDEFYSTHITYQPLSVGAMHLDPVKRRIVIRGKAEENLTEREFQLLYYLMQNSRSILSSRQLLEKIWGYGYGIESNLVPVYIGRLRRKIEPNPLKPTHIVRVRDLGYSFQP
jgi:two-component system response regulator RegX3